MIGTRFCYVLQHITIILKWNTHSHICKPISQIFYFILVSELLETSFLANFGKNISLFSRPNYNTNCYHTLYIKHYAQLFISLSMYSHLYMGMRLKWDSVTCPKVLAVGKLQIIAKYNQPMKPKSLLWSYNILLKFFSGVCKKVAFFISVIGIVSQISQIS